MKTAWAWLGVAVLLAGCKSSPTAATDGPADRFDAADARDASTDAGADAGADLGTDADAPPDVPGDTRADVPGDTRADVPGDTRADVAADGPVEARADGGPADVPPSCNPPPALMFPDSDTVAQPYDVAMASSPTAGIATLWSRWSQGYDPPFGVFQPSQRTFGTTTKIVSDQMRSAEHVAMTALADGRFAAAWASDGGLGPEFLYASIGPETASPRTVALSYGGVREKVPSVAIAPFGSDRVAVAWIDIAPGGDDPVVIVDINDLTLTRVQQISITPLGTGALSVSLVMNGDQLFVLTSQLLPAGAGYELAMAKVARANLAVTAPKHIATLSLPSSTFAFTATNWSYVYVSGTDVVFTTADLDGNPMGAPQTVMPAPVVLGTMQLFWVDSAYHLTWFITNSTYSMSSLHYARLNANRQPVQDITLGDANVPRAVNLLPTPSGLFAGWFTMKGVFLSPLCP